MEKNKTLAIEVKNLSKSFSGRKAVDNLTLSIEKGRIYGFLGPNGSGKTTTMRLISGLLTADEGEGTCLGLNIRTQGEEIRKKIGYMTQKFSYWLDLTMKENLDFVASMFEISNKNEKLDRIIKDFGLEENQNKLAEDLSGGWKQRLSLAAAILHEPELLLLDEPTAGVDPSARREFWNKIHELSNLGITILVSTHYMDEAERCHKIIYILNGRLIAQGELSEIINQTGLISALIKSISQENLKLIEKKILESGIAEGITYLGEALKININKEKRSQLVEILQNNFGDQLKIDFANPTMEDSFIFFMKNQGFSK